MDACECKECGIYVDPDDLDSYAGRCYCCDTIRNQFAAAALTGSISTSSFDHYIKEKEDAAAFAQEAFLVADAMMEARKK